MTRYEWRRNYGFCPPEVSRYHVNGYPPVVMPSFRCLKAPDMCLGNIELFTGWFMTRVRRVRPGLVPIPQPMRLPPPEVVANMVKELLGYAKRGSTAEAVKEMTLLPEWEHLKDELLTNPNRTLTARMPLDHESIPRPFSSTCDGIYPIRQMIHVKAT